MKINIICNTETLAVGTILRLQEDDKLNRVYLLEKNKKLLKTTLVGFGLGEEKMVFLNQKEWENQLQQDLINNPVDMVWVFGFPWLIPSSIYQIPRLGFYNFHFGAFPDYKGADPIFWQIRNNEKAAGLVVHQINDELDGGPVVYNETIPIVPGENNAMYSLRAGFTAPELIPQILTAIEQGNFLAPLTSANNAYAKRPTYEQLCINWANQEADEIEALINASNPYYGGASTMIRGQEVKILEVSPADVTDNTTVIPPGTVVHADALYGLIVACQHQKFLRVNIISAREGYLSGVRLFALGIKAGDRFYHPDEKQIKNEHRQEAVSS